MSVSNFPFPCDVCGHAAAVHGESGCSIASPRDGLFPARQCLCTRTQGEASNPIPRLRRLRLVS
jgi:hypothetical protein